MAKTSLCECLHPFMFCHNCRKFYLIFFMLVIALGARGQIITTITVDTINRISKDAIPQDRQLLIIYPIGAAAVEKVFYYPVDNEGNKKKITRREYRQLIIKKEYEKKYNKKKGAFFQLRLYLTNSIFFSESRIESVKKDWPYKDQYVIPLDNFRIDKKGSNNNTLFIYSPALEPNRAYKYLILTKKGIKEADQLFDIWKLIDDGNEENAREKFIKIYPDDIRAIYKITFDGNGFIKLYKCNDSLKKAFHMYKNAKTALEYQKESPLASTIYDSCFQEIVHKTLTNDCKDCRLKYKGFIDSLELFNHTLVNLTNPDKLFSLGYLALSSKITDKSADTADFDQRFTNLKTSLKILKQLQYFIKLMSLEEGNSINCTQIEENIKVSLKTLAADTSLYSTFVNARTIWKKTFQDLAIGFYMYNNEQSALSTKIFDFKTRNRNYINACFGLVNYGAVYGRANFSQYSRFYDVSPFLGVNINLRPMDKDLPLSQVANKNFWMRTAVFAGITLNSLKDDNKTREDFFNRSNLSLLLGGSYRITNGIRMNYGTLLFKRPNSNPLLNRKLITAAPFAGFAIDLDLKELIGDVTAIFK